MTLEAERAEGTPPPGEEGRRPTWSWPTWRRSTGCWASAPRPSGAATSAAPARSSVPAPRSTTPSPARRWSGPSGGSRTSSSSDADAWLCYQCNDCITHCPVDARPGDVMAATRDLQMEEFAVPRFMSRITRDPKALPLAVAIPAVLVGLMVLGSQTFAGGDGVFPPGDVLFGHFLGEGWVDTFVVDHGDRDRRPVFLSLRRFWAALQSTVPADTPRSPLSTRRAGHAGRRLQPQGLRRLQARPTPGCGPTRPVLRLPRPDGRHHRGRHLHADLPPIGHRPPRRTAVAADLGPGQDRRQRRRRSPSWPGWPRRYGYG